MGKLIELKDRSDKRLVKLLMNKFHPQKLDARGVLIEGARYFALEERGLWKAIAIIHKPAMFRYLFRKFNIDESNSYFLRRILQLDVHDGNLELLQKICEKLKDEGKECLVALCLPRHSGALYKKLGFIEVGRTHRSKMKVFVKYLRG